MPPLPTPGLESECCITEAREVSKAAGNEVSATYDPELTFSTTWEVLVGPSKVSFTLHAAVLCERSPFFVAALKKNWNSNRTAIELPEDDPRVFNEYLGWLYSGESSSALRGEIEVFNPLIEAYIISDKFGDLKTANFIMDEILESSDRRVAVPTGPDIDLIYSNTPESSPLRRFAVDCFTKQAAEEAFKLNIRDSAPLAFLAEVANEMYCIANEDDPSEPTRWFREAKKCHYHMHNASHPACVESEVIVIDD